VSRSPFEILGVSHGADDETIRRAYLSLVQQFPPDRVPEKFRRIREAYDLIRDSRKRLEYELFHLPALEELNAFAHRLHPRRPTLAQFRKMLAECMKDVR